MGGTDERSDPQRILLSVEKFASGLVWMRSLRLGRLCLFVARPAVCPITFSTGLMAPSRCAVTDGAGPSAVLEPRHDGGEWLLRAARIVVRAGVWVSSAERGGGVFKA